MPVHSRLSAIVCALAALSSQFAVAGISVPVVWTGVEIPFIKPDDADPLLPANQDFLTENVRFTRGPTRGLVNAVTECDEFGCTYANSFSPQDTEWATDLILANDGLEIAAANWGALTFTDWETAYGNNVGNNIVGRSAVVHLITDNIYFDLEFTSWSARTGGGFAYIRTTPAAMPEPNGDYNNDAVVDAADYTVWRNTLGESVDPDGSGADGNANGEIDAGDYTFWKERYGDVIPPGAGGIAVVPEPASAVLLLAAMTAVALRRR